MACTVNKKAFCVLEFAKTESIVTVQRRFRTMYLTEPPTDKTIREWYMKFQQSGCLCAAKRRGRPGPMANQRIVIFLTLNDDCLHCLIFLNPFLLNFSADPQKLVFKGFHLLYFVGVSNQFPRTCKLRIIL